MTLYVQLWSEEIESHLSVADKCLNDMETKSLDLERNKSHAEAMELEEQLLEQKMEAAIKHEELTEKSSVVKLPKLTITSFNAHPSTGCRLKASSPR